MFGVNKSSAVNFVQNAIISIHKTQIGFSWQFHLLSSYLFISCCFYFLLNCIMIQCVPSSVLFICIHITWTVNLFCSSATDISASIHTYTHTRSTVFTRARAPICRQCTATVIRHIVIPCARRRPFIRSLARLISLGVMAICPVIISEQRFQLTDARARENGEAGAQI